MSFKATWYGVIHNCESMNPWKCCWLTARVPVSMWVQGGCLNVKPQALGINYVHVIGRGLQSCIWHYDCLDSHLKWQACPLIGPFGMVHKSWLLGPLNSPLLPCCTRLTNHQCLVACLVIWGSASIQETAGHYHKQGWHHYHTSSLGLNAEVHIISKPKVLIAKWWANNTTINNAH